MSRSYPHTVTMSDPTLTFTGDAGAAPASLLDLPWGTPLAEWPEHLIVPLPRGISRHVVRFVEVDGHVLALKEVTEDFAEREYRLLRALDELEIPAVQGVGVVSGRVDDHGEPLLGVLMTEHLTWSLPYRTVFSHALRPDTLDRLLDALVLLLVRLHLVGFLWGDCSLSNVLFRRDAGSFEAFLVDAETGELHGLLSDGQRAFDVDTAHINMAGGLLDLIAGGTLSEEVDPVSIADEVPRRYGALWQELTGSERIQADERWRIARRIERLNELGFDVAELDLREATRGRLRMQPKVVDSGHHSRRLLRLTGLDVGENQARRLLNDIDHFRARHEAATPRPPDQSPTARSRREAVAAHRWFVECYQPVIMAVPDDLRAKLEDAEVYHEVLEHRWYLSERENRDVDQAEAVADYIRYVLARRPDEEVLLPETNPTDDLTP